MIKICKNFTPKIDEKCSSIYIKDKEDSKRILFILNELEDTLDEPINKEFDPYYYELHEEPIELASSPGLEINARDYIYFTKTIKKSLINIKKHLI
ncbi:hypothetical protein [Gemella cuniculi]|uniref:hypothetical protein n=1 Tax=Gemella cuniculi TaxID=150240 RepID=UPI00040C7FBB|nr:hypothetical protein [Gemella cuniculi]